MNRKKEHDEEKRRICKKYNTYCHLPSADSSGGGFGSCPVETAEPV